MAIQSLVTVSCFQCLLSRLKAFSFLIDILNFSYYMWSWSHTWQLLSAARISSKWLPHIFMRWLSQRTMSRLYWFEPSVHYILLALIELRFRIGGLTVPTGQHRITRCGLNDLVNQDLVISVQLFHARMTIGQLLSCRLIFTFSDKSTKLTLFLSTSLSELTNLLTFWIWFIRHTIKRKCFGSLPEFRWCSRRQSSRWRWCDFDWSLH